MSGNDHAAAQQKPQPPYPVALKPAGAPKAISLGVVVSLGSAPGQGSEWSQPAQGAEVAAYRFRLGGTTVTLKPVDDQGTTSGSVRAVRSLVSQHVSGIVMGTAGSHIGPGLAQAERSGVPVVLPYDTGTATMPTNSWLTGPTSREVGAALASAISHAGAKAPVLVDAGGGLPQGVHPVARFGYRPGQDPEALARQIRRLTTSGPRADSVVVSGDAQLQAAVVRGLEGLNLGLPVYLTPDALSPDFPSTLLNLQGTLAGDLSTAGSDAGDPAAMTSSDDGRAMSAYFAGLRSASNATGVTDFFDQQPFRTVASVVDSRSHDAVVALVDAAAKAGSTQPRAVLAALKGLRLGHAEGIAGPALDFGSQEALPGAAVDVLQATTQNPGLRPGDPQKQGLFWFAQNGQ